MHGAADEHETGAGEAQLAARGHDAATVTVPRMVAWIVQRYS